MEWHEINNKKQQQKTTITKKQGSYKHVCKQAKKVIPQVVVSPSFVVRAYDGWTSVGNHDSFWSFSTFFGVLLGVGASEEMLMLSFLESRCVGTRRLLATDNNNERNISKKRIMARVEECITWNLFTCKTFHGFLTNHNEPSTCYLPNAYTHRTCKMFA